MRPAFRGLWLLAGGLVAGCTAPEEKRAAFLEAPAISRTVIDSGVARPTRAGAHLDREWWRAFRSPDLNQMVEKALADNQSLRKASDTLKEAQAGVDVASSRLTPFVDADLDFKQYRNAQNGVAAALNPAQAGLEKSVPLLNPISAKWELDFWGKNRALLQAAIGDAQAQEAEFTQARLLLSTSVTRAYVRGSVLAEQLKLARDLTKLRRELRQLAETRYATGLETLDVVQAARTNEETAARREISLAAAIAIQENALARLTGEGPDYTHNHFLTRRGGALTQPPLPKRLPIELLANRPDLMAALRRAEAWAERIHAAKTLFLPSMDLSVSAGLEASVTSTQFSKLGGYLFNPGAMVYSATPGVHLPIFQGGKVTGNLQIQRADYDQAVDTYNETLLTAAQQTADAVTNLKRYRQESESQARFIAARRAELELARSRLRQGMRDRREVTQEYADLLDAVFIKQGLDGDRMTAAVDLFQALGGGYEAEPGALSRRPSPEADRLNPVVETIQRLGGG